MDFRLILGVIFIRSIFVSTAISDSTWSSGDELLFQDTELPSNSEALAFNQVALPLDLADAPEGGSGSLFGDMGSIDLSSSDNDGTVAGEFFQLADCSSSELFPLIGKSRIRRLDGSADDCQNPENPTSEPPFDPSLDSASSQALHELLSRLRVSPGSDEGKNTVCRSLTHNLLPWGVCPSGDDADAIPAPGLWSIHGWGPGILFDLYHCTLGTFKSKSCFS